MFSAFRNPCDSPSKVMCAYGMPCAGEVRRDGFGLRGGTDRVVEPLESSSTGRWRRSEC